MSFTKNDYLEVQEENEKQREEMIEEGHFCKACGNLDYDYNYGKECSYCEDLIIKGLF